MDDILDSLELSSTNHPFLNLENHVILRLVIARSERGVLCPKFKSFCDKDGMKNYGACAADSLI
jgi:hypothetical protein